MKCQKCKKIFEKPKWRIRETEKKGSIYHFCSTNCYKEYRKGNNHPLYKGGRWITSDGYIRIIKSKHPEADKSGCILEHRYLVEKKIGRYLKYGEVVHHIDGDRQNNNIDNLMLFNNHSEHIKFHTKIKQFGITNPIKKRINERWEEFKNVQCKTI